MSQLTPNNWMTLEGAPVTGATPPRLIVVEGVMTVRQRAQVLHEYATFCLRKTTSICEHLTENRVLADGTRILMESMQGKDRVMVWPAMVPDRGGGAFIAVPAYVNLGFAPIFERPVINLAGDEKPPYPEEPEFDLPFPVQQFAPIVRVRFSQEYGAVVSFPEAPGSFFRNITYRSTITAGGEETYALDGSLTWTSSILFDLVNAPLVPMALPDPENPDKFWSAEYNNAGANPDDFPPGSNLGAFSNVYFFIRTGSNAFSGATQYKDFVPSGATGIAVSVSAALWTEYQSQEAAAAALNAAFEAAYLAAVEAWGIAHEEWLATTYQAWLDACQAIDDMYPPLGPYPGMAEFRAQERENQLTALRKWLDGGVQSSPHLAARMLEFPWNIATKPANTLPTLGDVTATGPNGGDINRYLDFTVTGADRQAIVPDPITDNPIDEAQFGHDAPHPLGRDFAMPRCLFGWVANGTYQRYAAYRAFHNAEPPEVRPHDLSTIAFDVRSQYNQFLAAGVVRATTNDARVNSDGYVPAGTRLTVVHLEYEVFDVFTGQWIWTPCFDIRRFDSLWIASLGRYTMPPAPVPPDGADRPRRVRIRKVQTLRRKPDMTWSVPELVDPKKLKDEGVWDKEVLSGTGNNPFAVVIFEGLPQTAFPIANGVLSPPLWSGDLKTIRELLAPEWDGNLNIPPLVAHALDITKKV